LRATLLAAVLGGCTAAAAAGEPAPAKLRIAFIAYENPNQLMENVEPVVASLEQRIGVEIEHFTATDYAGVVEALRNATADVGFMGALPYVMAHHHAGAYPIAGEVYGGSPTYRSRIFVRKDSGIASLEGLRGKSIAFVDPISSSGYLYPLDVFFKAGLVEDRERAERFFKRVYFAGGDEQAVRAVLNRFVDAAGIGQFAWSLLRPEERDQVVFIAESDPIPSHCVVVRAGLDRAVATRLQEALVGLDRERDADLLRRLYNVDGYVAVTHETYAGVEALARRHGFIGD
jgi:phosphonate transport system substrate-binding protein